MTEEIHQHESQLEEDERGTTEGLEGENLSLEVVAKNQFSDEEHAGVKTIEEWKSKDIREEDVFGSKCDFPIDKERVQ
jgi:hypothetical protein